MAVLRLNPALVKTRVHAGAPAECQTGPAADCGNALGDWALALAHTRPQKLIVAVSSVTRWAYALPAAPLHTLTQRFGPALLQALLALGVPPDRARTEVQQSEPWLTGRGIDRGVSTHLRQYAESVGWAAGEGLGLGAINTRLSEHLTRRPREGYPAEEVLRLLGGNPGLVVQRQKDKHDQWRKAFDHAQAQIGREEVHIPVSLALPDQPRLEAAHQAAILLMRLPHDDGVSGPPSRTGNPRGRWIPRTLVIDFSDVDSATPIFARALLDEVAALGVASLHLANAEPGVLEAFERVARDTPR